MIKYLVTLGLVLASSSAFAAPTVEQLLQGATLQKDVPDATGPATPSPAYMPPGCMSSKDGCCFITAAEYQNLVRLADENAGSMATIEHSVNCHDGVREVTQEPKWPNEVSRKVKF